MSRLDNYEILNQLKYIDGITIIDNKGTILFTIKFNRDFTLKFANVKKF
ncbi:hypothetical protein [Peribacillus simplex]